MASEFSHQPVLLDEVLEALNIKPGGIYLDATFGRGGHTKAILDRLGSEGRMLAFDQDPEAIEHGRRQFADESRIEFVHCNFSQVERVIVEHGLEHRIDGVLMDLGVSSPQLDDAERGFSFLRSGPLDMRMDTSKGESAMQWLAKVKFHDLVNVLRRYGEERFAKRIASAVLQAREIKAAENKIISETGELAEIIANAVPVKEKNKHPATRSFQAIRIYINQELQAIEQGLQGAASVLAVGGRLAVISFHSLEDRMVKRFMRDSSSRPRLPAGLPIIEKDEEPPYRLVGKGRVAGKAETSKNPRARSARLRVLERVQ
jgi:16S rRNA (cytosine1402-N4)-methyltransferase